MLCRGQGAHSKTLKGERRWRTQHMKNKIAILLKNVGASVLPPLKTNKDTNTCSIEFLVRITRWRLKQQTFGSK